MGRRTNHGVGRAWARLRANAVDSQESNAEGLGKRRGSQAANQGQAGNHRQGRHSGQAPQVHLLLERTKIDQKLAGKTVQRRQTANGNCSQGKAGRSPRFTFEQTA